MSSDPPLPADVLAILSGNDENRIREAARLYHDGIANNILLSRTGQTFGDYDQPYYDVQILKLYELGVPRTAIYTADITAKNTGQEASGIVSRMYEYGFRSVLVITDSWHTRRVRTIFTDTFGNTPFQLRIYGVPDPQYNQNFWWLTPAGWKITVSEYIRILGYLIKRDTNIPDYPRF